MVSRPEPTAGVFLCPFSCRRFGSGAAAGGSRTDSLSWWLLQALIAFPQGKSLFCRVHFRCTLRTSLRGHGQMAVVGCRILSAGGPSGWMSSGRRGPSGRGMLHAWLSGLVAAVFGVRKAPCSTLFSKDFCT